MISRHTSTRLCLFNPSCSTADFTPKKLALTSSGRDWGPDRNDRKSGLHATAGGVFTSVLCHSFVRAWCVQGVSFGCTKSARRVAAGHARNAAGKRRCFSPEYVSMYIFFVVSGAGCGLQKQQPESMKEAARKPTEGERVGTAGRKRMLELLWLRKGQWERACWKHGNGL